MTTLSIIVPTLNEAPNIESALRALAPLRAQGHEVIVVDGGSQDFTVQLASPLADIVLSASRGRAAQMNVGVHEARGDVLLFLHADTRLPADADKHVLQGLADGRLVWGRFDVRIAGRHPLLILIARTMNLRSRLTAICTGDQAIFVRREVLIRLGGYPDIDLMEDVALSRILRRVSRPLCLRTPVTTSGRRWESRGVWQTMLLMWWLRLRYFFGTSPARLVRIYDDDRR
jgi:rSAM/selenodomain-associated transferase 2